MSNKLGPKKLSVLCFNANSIEFKFPGLCSNLSLLQNKYSFIIITETWLNINKDVALEFPGFNSFAVYRSTQTNGGGVKIYCLNSVSAAVDQFTYVHDSSECLTIRTMVPGYGRLLLSGLYRPTYDSNFNCFMFNIESLVTNNVQSRIIWTNDLNLNFFDSNSIKVSRYINLLTSYGQKITIDLPTYVWTRTGTDTTCLDH